MTFHNVFWIGPIALPLLLFTLNAVVKVTLGAFNIHAFGADMTFAAVALCATTLFRHIASGAATKGSHYAPGETTDASDIIRRRMLAGS